MAVELPFATPAFDAIRLETGVDTEDAIRLIWLMLQDEINKRERLAQTVGGTTGHNLLSPTHPDTIPASPIQGDIITALGSTPVDNGKYWLDGHPVFFEDDNSDTGGAKYWLDGHMFAMGGFGLTVGTGTKWQRKAIGAAGLFLGSTGTEVEWLSPTSISESVAAYRSTSQAISQNADTAINLSAVSFDTAAFWAGATPTRLTVPTGKAGKYIAIGQIQWTDGDIGTLQTKIRKNGTTVVSLGALDTTITGVTSAPGASQASTLLSLADGDYLELVAYWNYTDAVPRTAVGGETSTFLQLIKVG
jgi:hypothetical protein